MKAPRYWVEYAASWRDAPLAFWVHVERDARPWHAAETFSPPAPRPVGHQGFAILCVDLQGTVLNFSALEQLTECIRVLSSTPLPPSRRLAQSRGSSLGPNRHWLSRLPARLKAPRARARAVRGLTEVLRHVTARPLASPWPARAGGRYQEAGS